MVYKKTEIRNIVLDYARELKKKRLPIKKIVLYGSYAYGRPGHGSDIDIAIVSDKFKNMDDIKRIMFLSDCARHVECDVDIDPIGFTEEELKNADYFEIGGEIEENGVVLYESM